MVEQASSSLFNKIECGWPTTRFHIKLVSLDSHSEELKAFLAGEYSCVIDKITRPALPGDFVLSLRLEHGIWIREIEL